MKTKTTLMLMAGLLLVGSASATMLDFTFVADANAPTASDYFMEASGLEYGEYVSGTSGTAWMAEASHPYDWFNANAIYSAGAEGWTPNLELSQDWSSSTGISLKYYTVGYGDLEGVMWSANGDGELLTVVPDAGYGVKIHSFDLAHWSADTALTSIQIIDYSTKSVLWTHGGSNTIEGDTHTGIAPDYTGALGQTLQILISGGGLASFAMDNAVISQIPEPATISLLGIVGASMLVIRRKFMI